MSDKILLSKIIDKIKFSKSRNQITNSEFLNEYQVPVRMITENGFYNTLFFLT